jgi:hypothetical protein
MNGNENQNETRQNTTHRFDRLMFGDRKLPSNPGTSNQPSKPSPTNEIDLIGMLENVDQLMGSINKFKPMVKQLSPLLDLFKAKK